MWDAAFGEDEEDRKEEESKEMTQDNSSKGINAKFVRAGYHPTQKEIDEHMPLHLPYRAWCSHCVKGKCHRLQHRRKDKEEKEDEQVRLVSIDYMFMSDSRKERRRVCRCWLPRIGRAR